MCGIVWQTGCGMIEGIPHRHGVWDSVGAGLISAGWGGGQNQMLVPRRAL